MGYVFITCNIQLLNTNINSCLLDNEDFDIPTSSKSTAVTGSWEDEVDDDEPILESWDVDSDEEREKNAAKKKAEEEEKKKRAEAKAAKNKKKEKTLFEIDLVDEKTRKEMLRRAEVDADLNNAADLFGGLGVADHPRARAAANEPKALRLNADTPLTAHPLFNPTTKQDFEKLRKVLGTTLTDLAKTSQLFYANSLAIDLARDLCEPLTTEQTRKVISTLNALVTKKVKEERQSRLSKTGGTSLGGAGKKKAKAGNVNTGPANFKKDNLDEFMGGDDLSDDDFM